MFVEDFNKNLEYMLELLEEVSDLANNLAGFCEILLRKNKVSNSANEIETQILKENAMNLSNIGLSLMELIEDAKHINFFDAVTKKQEYEAREYNNVICFPLEIVDDNMYVCSDETNSDIFKKDEDK